MDNSIQKTQKFSESVTSTALALAQALLVFKDIEIAALKDNSFKARWHRFIRLGKV